MKGLYPLANLQILSLTRRMSIQNSVVPLYPNVGRSKQRLAMPWRASNPSSATCTMNPLTQRYAFQSYSIVFLMSDPLSGLHHVRESTLKMYSDELTDQFVQGVAENRLMVKELIAFFEENMHLHPTVRQHHCRSPSSLY